MKVIQVWHKVYLQIKLLKYVIFSQKDIKSFSEVYRGSMLSGVVHAVPPASCGSTLAYSFLCHILKNRRLKLDTVLLIVRQQVKRRHWRCTWFHGRLMEKRKIRWLNVVEVCSFERPISLVDNFQTNENAYPHTADVRYTYIHSKSVRHILIRK